MSSDYQALTHTKIKGNNMTEKEHQNLGQKPEFKSWNATRFPCNK